MLWPLGLLIILTDAWFRLSAWKESLKIANFGAQIKHVPILRVPVRNYYDNETEVELQLNIHLVNGSHPMIHGKQIKYNDLKRSLAGTVIATSSEKENPEKLVIRNEGGHHHKPKSKGKSRSSRKKSSKYHEDRAKEEPTSEDPGKSETHIETEEPVNDDDGP